MCVGHYLGLFQQTSYLIIIQAFPAKCTCQANIFHDYTCLILSFNLKKATNILFFILFLLSSPFVSLALLLGNRGLMSSPLSLLAELGPFLLGFGVAESSESESLSTFSKAEEKSLAISQTPSFSDT